MLFRDVLRPGSVFAIEVIRLVGIEYHGTGEEIAGEIAVFGEAGRTQIENVECELHVFGARFLHQIGLRFGELVDVLLKEENMRRIQQAEIFIEHLAGERLVHLAPHVVIPFQQIHHQRCDLPHLPVGRLRGKLGGCRLYRSFRFLRGAGLQKRKQSECGRGHRGEKETGKCLAHGKSHKSAGTLLQKS